MNTFGQVLVKMRLELDYKTSKSFFNYLKSKGLECNYQYFVKIEKNLSLPSSTIVNQIAKALERDQGEKIIQAFCREQFNSFSYLFEESTFAPDIEKTTNSKQVVVAQGQKELTIRQVEALKKKKENYFLFLILTLSRHPVKIKDLNQINQLKKCTQDLVDAALAILENDTIRASSAEFIFPKSQDGNLDEAYSMFDAWDREFSQQFEFKKYLNKMMIRRISPRYFTVMLKQIEAFTDFVRCSDESDQRYNNDVLHMHISISKGTLPG